MTASLAKTCPFCAIGSGQIRAHVVPMHEAGDITSLRYFEPVELRPLPRPALDHAEQAAIARQLRELAGA